MDLGWSARDKTFYTVFYVFLAAAAVWLLLGLLPAIASTWPALHDWLHDAGSRGRGLSEISRNAAQTSHSARSGLQVTLDYLFSVINLGLGLLLLRLRPRDLTAQLLALGMVGTAVAFNLQGHDALQVVPVGILGRVDAFHVVLHVASGLSYLFALLLFPDGRLVERGPVAEALRVLVVAFLALVFTGFSLFTVDDHATGLVMVFGVMVPIAGVATQVGRYRRARTEDQRRRSRVLLLALVIALGTAVPLILTTNARGDVEPSRVVEYEVTIDQPGIYFYRCDPHPDDMTGTVQVTPGASGNAVAVTARNNEFNVKRFGLTAGVGNTIRFTNFDADLHNVAIYRSRAADSPLFIGAEFSGQASAVVAFRVFRIIFAVIPLALIAGLVRFHLWDVDRVINRALLNGVLVAFITVAYLVAVVLVGAVFGAGARLNLILSIALTAVIAAAFQPLRDRARRVANRLVYGRRASPYEVMTEFSERVGGTFAMDEALPKIAEIVGTGTGARRAEVWLRIGTKLVLSASWPETRDRTSVELVADELPPLPGATLVAAVEHRGELLGAIAVADAPGQPLDEVEQRLLTDVATQAGLVLRNARLAAELRASRHRIVAAQDEERRRLERDIHDGAQQHLVALSAKLRLVQELADKDAGKARALLTELQNDANRVMNELRDLARGIYPSILADKGLTAALDAHARRLPVEVRVEGDQISRVDSAVENAVYFCCLEALQNAVKHGAPPVHVTLGIDGRLEFSVSDRGAGFDRATTPAGAGLQNMSDRLAALGGELEIVSRPGSGTTVIGRVPLRPPAE